MFNDEVQVISIEITYDTNYSNERIYAKITSQLKNPETTPEIY